MVEWEDSHYIPGWLSRALAGFARIAAGWRQVAGWRDTQERVSHASRLILPPDPCESFAGQYRSEHKARDNKTPLECPTFGNQNQGSAPFHKADLPEDLPVLVPSPELRPVLGAWPGPEGINDANRDAMPRLPYDHGDLMNRTQSPQDLERQCALLRGRPTSWNIVFGKCAPFAPDAHSSFETIPKSLQRPQGRETSPPR